MEAGEAGEPEDAEPEAPSQILHAPPVLALMASTPRAKEIEGLVPVLCDRILLERCIAEWFGSVEAFDEFVRLRVLPSLKESIGAFCPDLFMDGGCLHACAVELASIVPLHELACRVLSEDHLLAYVKIFHITCFLDPSGFLVACRSTAEGRAGSHV